MKTNFIARYTVFKNGVSKLESAVLLFIRLVLAYGFYEPAVRKWKNITGIGDWFASMNYPLPQLNAYLAASTEAAGFVLLAIGLGTRIISIPLMIVMLVAIFTVHISNGFAAGENGFEIPLYYLLMLMVLLVRGSGKISLDYFLLDKN